MSKTDPASRLRALRAELGTKELARRLGIPEPSLRRLLSTGKWSKRLAARRDALLFEEDERAAIVEEQAPQIVPGYSPEKQRRVWKELVRRRSQAALDWQEIRNAVRAFRTLTTPEQLELLNQKVREFELLQRAEERMRPQGEWSIDEVIDRLRAETHDPPARTMYSIAQRFQIEARAVYALFFSPPTHGVAIAS